MSDEKKNVFAFLGSAAGYAAVAAACLAIGWVACRLNPEKPKPPSEQQLAIKALRTAPPIVSVEPVRMLHDANPQTYPANVEAIEEVDLVPQVDGYIKEILFREGDLVKEGQVLYTLDDERYRAVLNQRQADLDAAKAECDRAEKYNVRMQKADRRGVTDLERDNAEAGAAKARAAVAQAEANLKVAKYDCDHAQVVSPLTGRIGKTFVHVGDYVSPAKGPLAHVVQIDPIRVVFPMPDREYGRWLAKEGGVKHRLQLRLPTAAGDADYEDEGTWDFVDNQMSRETASILMRATFPNARGRLVPNKFVKLRLSEAEGERKTPHVMQQAVVDLGEGRKAIWILKEDGTVARLGVVVGEQQQGWVPVRSEGLPETAKVVVSGMPKLSEGRQVIVVPATPNPDHQSEVSK